MRALLTSALLASAVALSPLAHAGKKSEEKAMVKVFSDEAAAAYPGVVWALKDLPVNTGLTMGIPWIGPTTTVTPAGFEIEAAAGMQATFGSASSVWFGVRPYDALMFKEVTYDDAVWTITFNGTADSDGRDTKIKIVEAVSFSQVKPVLDQLLSATDPILAYPDWSAEVNNAIRKRVLVNGMTKRQAYMVVGEPSGSSTREEDGKKIEVWNPRPNNGMRIGYASSMESTGWPAELRFEDGELVGIATTAGGGVSLD